MQKNTYLVITSWMRDDLKLSGTELLVYAVIYGFSQDGSSRFTGSRQYIADWCGCTTRSVQNILNDLTERGLLTKYEETINNVKHCEYVANFTTSEKISPPPSEKISLYNIDNHNIDNSIISINRNNTEKSEEMESHSYSPKELKDDFLGSIKKTEKPKRKSLYDKCVDEVYLYTKSIALQDALIRYLSVRLSIKEKPMYGVNQWKALLHRLDITDGDKVSIVEQSIEKGWCSFYELRNNSRSVFSEGEGISCEQATDTAEEREEKLRKQGKRTKF